MQVVFYYLLRRVMISSYTSGRFSFRCSSSICLRSLKRSAHTAFLNHISKSQLAKLLVEACNMLCHIETYSMLF